MNVSKKNILKIREFMMNFLGIDYEGNSKLTHEEFNNYLSLKRKPHVNRAVFREIKNYDILTGKYILVRDDVGKIIPYERPKFMRIDLEQINKSKVKKI